VEGGPDGVRKASEDQLEFRDRHSGMVMKPVITSLKEGQELLVQ